jgi:putative SOS response-associated peptidase YedK
MCGRYALSRGLETLLADFGLAAEDVRAPEEIMAAIPNFNVSPGTDVVVAGAGAGAARERAMVRWGLLPAWAKSAGQRPLVNARAETAAEKPAFRGALAQGRVLVPADGYFEWLQSPAKQPYFLRRADSGVMAMAALVSRRRGPARPGGGQDAWVTTMAVLTTAAAPKLAAIHGRMPVVLERGCWETWLSPDSTKNEVLALLSEPGAWEAEAYRVSSAVNRVANNYAALCSPIESRDSGTLF